MNGAVTFYRQIGPYAVTQCDAPVPISDIDHGWRLSQQGSLQLHPIALDAWQLARQLRAHRDAGLDPQSQADCERWASETSL